MLINDSLDLYTKEEKEIKPSCTHFNVSKIVEECINLMKFNYKSKGIRLISEVSENIPIMYSDEQRFKRIILNLLGNALKFTKIGYVKIKLKYLQDKQVIYCSIRDTGIGIPKEDLVKLFTRFEKLSSQETDNPTGLGIGLSVCKTLSLVLGGDIKANSTIGKGTKFSVWIPINYQSKVKKDEPFEGQVSVTVQNVSEVSEIEEIKELDSPNHLIKTENSSRFLLPNSRRNIIFESSSSHSKLLVEEEEKGKPNVLIVDDEISIINAIQSCLKRLNIKYEFCFNGLDAVEKVRNKFKIHLGNLYDLIIMDYEMNEMNGIQALQEMNKLFELYKFHPKVIICSGDSNPELLNAIASNNAIFIQKPLKFEKIKEIVNELKCNG